MRHMMVCLSAGIAVLLLSQVRGISAETPAVRQHSSAIERFLTSAETPLVSYEAVRTLEASTRGGSMRARIVATTSLSPDDGFRYSIVEEEGSSLIRRRVLEAALEAEHRIVANDETGRGALTPANYEFVVAPHLSGEPDASLVSVQIRPRRRDTMLVDGTIELSNADGELTRVSGILVKRPSFWTRRVAVTRDYARVAGVRVPIRMQSTASVLIAGTATFAMSYDYQSINGQPLKQD